MSHAKSHALEASKATDSQAAETNDSLTLDDIFSLLSNSRRRAAIKIMLEHERLDFGKLVDKVAELEYQLPIEDISGDERHTIYVSLQQTHKKRLVESGVIESVRDTGAISLGPNADDMIDFMAKIDETSKPESLRGKVASLF